MRPELAAAIVFLDAKRTAAGTLGGTFVWVPKRPSPSLRLAFDLMARGLAEETERCRTL